MKFQNIIAMKQAILLTAYKNFEDLIDLISFFDESFEIYLHIDKKNRLDKQTKEKLLSLRNLKLLSRKYCINWGGIHHLYAYLDLCKEALKNENIHYFHLISGQDFPVKSISYFKEFFSESQKNSFLEYFTLPAEHLKFGGMDRIEFYNFYDFINAKKHLWIIKSLIKQQRRFNIHRKWSDSLPRLMGGSTYWSLTRDALQFVLDYTTNKPELLKRLRYTFCAEEIYFQTILLSSRFAHEIINDNLRYIDWTPRHESIPAILDESDYHEIIASKSVFARKFDPLISGKLKEMLMKRIRSSS